MTHEVLHHDVTVLGLQETSCLRPIPGNKIRCLKIKHKQNLLVLPNILRLFLCEKYKFHKLSFPWDNRQSGSQLPPAATLYRQHLVFFSGIFGQKRSSQGKYLHRIHDDLEAFHSEIIRIPEFVVVQMSAMKQKNINQVSSGQSTNCVFSKIFSKLTRANSFPFFSFFFLNAKISALFVRSQGQTEEQYVGFSIQHMSAKITFRPENWFDDGMDVAVGSSAD